MANNLHVSYDLHDPGKNYDAVINRIKLLGNWAKIHYSFWYVNSQYSASQAVDSIRQVMDQNDSVYVVDASTNNAAWHNISNEAATFIRDQWMK